ncbi:carboxy terminal-processing peptidase [Acanthopleuribacter pedis]|uniref:Carboxy terminal-processing peptidase n=1 Tax=Acanthopleuribacter pedis TaxID=442870 RepID=A0A8J7QL21_9BACT|nr:carboxy terminal-processing peptidase [Acanthopleuribacter pedis]MBO1323051.1 carboxy terminal-processing peptidase [Acanthopleuribacter pedis]
MVYRKIIVLLLLCLIVPSSLLADKDIQPPQHLKPVEYQPYVASLVSNYLSIYHYSGLDLNNETSKRIFKEYLETLDYNRLFFLESDIQEFSAWDSEFDDYLRVIPANLSKAYTMYNRLRNRVDQRADVILKLLEEDFDLEKDEMYQPDRSKADYAKTEAELNALWRLRLKAEMLRFSLQGTPKDEMMDILRKRYARLKRNNSDVDATDVLETFLASVCRSFDPHSSYLKPITKENFDIEMGHSLEGIGATLRSEGGYTVIQALMKGGPAFESGQVDQEDKIVAVAQGMDGEWEDIVDLRLDKVVQKIRGPKGTTVRLNMIPADAADYSETKEVILVRDKVKITAMDARAEIREIEGPNNQSMRVGVIEIPSFYMDTQAKIAGDPNYKSTTRDVRRLIRKLEAEKIDGLVLDLRQNGGGALDEAIELTGLFIEEGPVVQIKDLNGRIRVNSDPDENIVYRGPLAVLTSVFSASASEILAGAIQDYDRGLVIGSKSTHGKGTVQNVFSLQTPLNKQMRRAFTEDVAGALKMTTLKFYRISGGSTQFKGVVPDVILPSPYDDLEVGEENLEHALAWDEIKPADYTNFRMVTALEPTLRANSAKRIAKEPEFGYLKEDQAYRQAQRDRNTLSLKLSERKAERERLEKIDDNRNEARKQRKSLIKIEGKFVLENDQVVPDEEEVVAKKPKKDDAEAAEKPEGEDASKVAKKDKKEDKVEVPDYILEEGLFVLRDFIWLTNEGIAGVSPGTRPLKEKNPSLVP